MDDNYDKEIKSNSDIACCYVQRLWSMIVNIMYAFPETWISDIVTYCVYYSLQQYKIQTCTSVVMPMLLTFKNFAFGSNSVKHTSLRWQGVWCQTPIFVTIHIATGILITNECLIITEILNVICSRSNAHL